MMQDLEIARQLCQHPHVRPRALKVESQDGVLVIEGKVETFFAKQMAQESLRQLEGIDTIENRLKVDRVRRPV